MGLPPHATGPPEMYDLIDLYQPGSAAGPGYKARSVTGMGQRAGAVCLLIFFVWPAKAARQADWN